jgi:hypothetical protein
MAANTGIYHGSDMLLYVDDTAVGHATSHDLDVKSELIVRRTKDTGKFPTRKLTGIDASASCKALVLYDGYSFKDLLTAQLEGTPLTLTLRGHSNSEWGVPKQAGDWYIEMPTLVSNNSMNASQNEDGSFTVSFELNGELSIETET